MHTHLSPKELPLSTGHSTDSHFLPVQRENGLPLISLSDQKDIALEVKVTNLNGDDAYEAAVLATFPKSLTYSAFRVPPNVSLPVTHTYTERMFFVILTGIHYLFQERKVICVANKDGSQADCELGNPFKRNSEVRIKSHSHTHGLHRCHS